MRLTDFKEYFIDLVEDLQYKVWISTKTKYNIKKEIGVKEILIEPFNIPLIEEGKCDYNTTLTLWVAIRREIDDKFINECGDDTEFIDYMYDETEKIIKLINASDKIQILNKLSDIQFNYFESDSNQLINSQSLMRFTLNVKIYI